MTKRQREEKMKELKDLENSCAHHCEMIRRYPNSPNKAFYREGITEMCEQMVHLKLDLGIKVGI